MTTAQVEMTPKEVVERGKSLYQNHLRPKLSDGNVGKYLVIDTMTGGYEMGDTHLETAERARTRYLDSRLYGMRIGYAAIASFGAALQPDTAY